MGRLWTDNMKPSDFVKAMREVSPDYKAEKKPDQRSEILEKALNELSRYMEIACAHLAMSNIEKSKNNRGLEQDLKDLSDASDASERQVHSSKRNVVE